MKQCDAVQHPELYLSVDWSPVATAQLKMTLLTLQLPALTHKC